MKKNIYLIIIGTITLFCILYGTYRLVKNYNFKIQKDDFSEYEEDGGFSKALESFSKLELDANILQIEIEPSDTFWVKASYNKPYLEPKVNVQNGKLEIRQSVKKSRGNNSAKLFIGIPVSENLLEIDAKVNVGEIDISKIKCDSIKAKTDVGAIKIENCLYSSLNVKTDVGEIRLSEPKDFSDFSVKCKTDIGEIRVLKNDYRHTFEQSGNSKKKIDARTNVGEISIK